MSETETEQDPETTGPTTIPDEQREDEEALPVVPAEDEEAEAEAAEEPEQDIAFEEPEPQGYSEKELEKMSKAIDKLREHVANRLGTIMGDDATLLEACPLCGDGTPGHVFPPNVAPVSPETFAAAQKYLGMPDPETFNYHPNYAKCEACNGRGEIMTGSVTPSYMLTGCPDCGTKGYIVKGQLPIPSAANGNVETAPAYIAPSGQGDELPPELAHYKEQGWFIMPPAQTMVTSS